MRRYQQAALLVATGVVLLLHVHVIRERDRLADGLVDRVDALTKRVMEVQAELDSVRLLVS